MSLIFSVAALAIAVGNLVWLTRLDRRTRPDPRMRVLAELSSRVQATVGETGGRQFQDGFKRAAEPASRYADDARLAARIEEVRAKCRSGLGTPERSSEPPRPSPDRPSDELPVPE